MWNSSIIDCAGFYYSSGDGGAVDGGGDGGGAAVGGDGRLVVMVVRNRMEGFVLVVINEDRSDECDIRNNEQSFGVES